MYDKMRAGRITVAPVYVGGKRVAWLMLRAHHCVFADYLHQSLIR